VNVTKDEPYYYTNDMQAAWHDPDKNITRGWFHLEIGTGTQSFFVGEIAYAESNDYGINFKPNQFDRLKSDRAILSSGPYFKTAEEVMESGTRNGGTGPHWLVEVGDYLYMYYIDMWGERVNGTHRFGVCLAHATKESGGVPGSWFKWYKGSFSEPGIRGNCSILGSTSATAVIKVLLRPPLSTPTLHRHPHTYT